MKEKLVYFPFNWTGTVPADSGTIIIVPCVGLSFRYGGVYVPTDCGATVTVTSQAAGQGTATLPLGVQAAGGGGSVWYGTAATLGTAAGMGTPQATGTVIPTLYIPKDGSVIIAGSAGTGAGTATVLSGYVAFAIGEG